MIAFAVFEPKKALAAFGVGLGGWLVFGTLTETVERGRLFRAPLAETLRRLRALPLGSWGTTLAHLGLGLFVMGAVVETNFKAETDAVVPIGGEVRAGPYLARLDAVRVVEGPNYLAEQATLSVERSGEATRTVTAERRFFPAGGQTTTEVGLDFRGLDDVYLVIGERSRTEAGEQAWVVRAHHNPWARLIFLGPAIMALAGLLSLFDRRLRVAAPARRKAAA